MDSYVDNEAELESEEEMRVDYDDEEPRRRPVNQNGGKARRNFDSSEEEDDDDDEEAARIRDGFIVDDEDEDQEEELEDGTTVRINRKKKRRRSQREEDDDDEGLDEEDIDLVLENTGEGYRRSEKSHFKRLKRGREESRRSQRESRGLNDIFSDDEELNAPGDADDEGLEYDSNRRGRAEGGEFDDFIESDSEDEDRRLGSDDEMRAARKRGARAMNSDRLGLPENAMADMVDIFDIGEYEDALVIEQETAELEEKAQDLQLKDVFEPSELAERMLTDDDNKIRWEDVPERLQLLRKPFRDLRLTQAEQEEEVNHIANTMFQQSGFEPELHGPYRQAVLKVLELFNVDNYEVPFIYQQRKDYLIHTVKTKRQDAAEGEAPYILENTKMLFEPNLWAILGHDLKFRAFVEKRNHFKKLYQELLDMGIPMDLIVEDRLPKAENKDHINDLHDYLHFKYQSELKSVASANDSRRRRPGTSKSVFERIRSGKVYGLVAAFGITHDQFALNMQLGKKREFTEDPDNHPEILADQFFDGIEFQTADAAMQAAKVMLAEEIFTNPRMRSTLRQRWFTESILSVNVTEKGVKQIDEFHQYYEFKYLRNQSLIKIARRPGMFLKMMKAESDGYIDIEFELEDSERLHGSMHEFIISDNYNEIAEAWNKERREVVDTAWQKFKAAFEKQLRDELKNACEDEICKAITQAYSRKLDQAPFQAKGLGIGEIPRVLAVSNGRGELGRDAIVGVFMDESTKFNDSFKLNDLRDETSREKFAEHVKKRKPDVIGVSGRSVQTNRLCEEIRKIVSEKDLRVQDSDGGDSLIEVVFVNDECARLYENSDRARVDHPDLPPLARYCCALARYVQNPILEYAALGKDIVSINFHPAQGFIGEEKLNKALEVAMVDYVNLVGVDINLAVNNPYVANLLPYVCGLGPRKALSMIKLIGINGGKVMNRQELLGVGDRELAPVVGPKVFENCASFLYVPYDKDKDHDYFDGTRVHPEEYELGRKMAADALDLDEEDIAAEVDKNGKSAIVNKLADSDLDRLNELILEDYAEELEKNFNQRKRATLEAIRSEIIAPYEELRSKWQRPTTEEVFTMLTGETKQTLDVGMVVPVNIRRVSDRYVAARLDCGIEGNVSVDEMPIEAVNVRPSYYYTIGQTVQARIENINYQSFYAELSLKEEKIRRPRRPELDVPQEEWDDVREERDKAKMAVRNQEQTRTARVIKHPLFRQFNSRQAEEFLAGQSRGDAVIRPSSNGPDHIAVTWKVADGIYQHLDVLELDKKNEFTVGKTLRVGQKFNYSDLDELIVNHVKAMAKKVDELTRNPKFQNGTKEEAEKWLEKYCEANPKRSSYRFCLDPKTPGYFMLLFKAGASAKMGVWHVKVVPGAFQLRGTAYPDVITLCNGFKTMHTHMAQRGTAGHGRPRI